MASSPCRPAALVHFLFYYYINLLSPSAPQDIYSTCKSYLIKLARLRAVPISKSEEELQAADVEGSPEDLRGL